MKQLSQSVKEEMEKRSALQDEIDHLTRIQVG